MITGVGGTGVVTIGAILAQAAHIDGKGAGMMEMAGLAQKGELYTFIAASPKHRMQSVRFAWVLGNVMH